MEILQIDRTESSPKIYFDPEEQFLQIKGSSRPENAKRFYTPLIEALKTFEVENNITSVPMSVEIKLSYFNSATIVFLTDAFKIISNMHSKGLKVLVDWFVDKDDEVIHEAGQELSDLTDLPFNFIED